ncbi:MAG: stage II sporulation protein M [Pseudomonadota bacterium]
MSSENARQQWINQRVGRWQQIEASLEDLSDGKPLSMDTLRDAMRAYPELAADLAYVRAEAPHSQIVNYLDKLYREMHRVLHLPARSRVEDLRHFLKFEVPGLMKLLSGKILAVTALFVLTGFAGWWLIATFPDLIGLVASPAMVDQVQEGKLWTDDLLNIMPSSVLAIGIFTNNVAVTLTAMVFGVLYGLGTLYIISLNGIMLGGVFSFVHKYGFSDELLRFVVAHGFVELSIICIAGGVGFYIGEAIARPGHLTRLQSFQQATRNGLRLLMLCIPFMIGAGVIEGYISPDASYSMAFCTTVGIVYWIVFGYALAGWPGLFNPKLDPAASGEHRS